MARTQRLDQEKFPIVLIFLVILTSLGTMSVLFFGSRSIYRPKSSTISRLNKINDNGNQHNVENPSEYQSLVRNIVSDSVLEAEVVYIMPGGGSGTDILKVEYPEWCKQRVVAAHKHSLEVNKNSVFLALSAGSLNAPNTLQSDSKIIFESQFMLAHLAELGVSGDRTFGDTMSWDTVTNALVARQFIEGILSLRKMKSRLRDDAKSNFREPVNDHIPSFPLNVEVFISDFHAERVKAAFYWIFDLEPSLFKSGGITFSVHSVNSESVVWNDKEEFEERVRHESAGVIQIQKNAKIVLTVSDLYAFLLLGPHEGLNTYLHNLYVPSSGAGWAR